MSYKVLSEMRDGICIAEIYADEIIEQELNARVMDDAKFSQLVANIKKRGELEQLPYCAKTEKGVEVVSGHHRVRAAKLAGLSKITILLDRSGLSRSAIAAKQIAHNSIEGTDDKEVLRQISAIITDVDDMLETALGNEFFKNAMAEVEKATVPKVEFEWKTIQFMFLPHMLGDLERLQKAVKTADWNGIAPIGDFDATAEAIRMTSDMENVRNVGATIHAMIKRTLEVYEGVSTDQRDYETVSSVFGRGVIPDREAALIKAMIRDAMDAGKIENPWEIFGVMAEMIEEGM